MSDQGANFMLTLLSELYRILGIKWLQITAYHPRTDGLVESFNGTFNAMLKKVESQSLQDWYDYLLYLLFAYREVP